MGLEATGTTSVGGRIRASVSYDVWEFGRARGTWKRIIEYVCYVRV